MGLKAALSRVFARLRPPAHPSSRVRLLPRRFLSAEIVGDENRAIAPSHIVSLFASDGGLLKQVVLGLGGGAFAGKRLEFDYDSQTAWFFPTHQSPQ